MTNQEAKNEIPDVVTFTGLFCSQCQTNTDYCTGWCQLMLKMLTQIPFEKIQKAYARHDGDLNAVCNYIRRYKKRNKRSEV